MVEQQQKISVTVKINEVLCSMRNMISHDTKGIFLWELIVKACYALYKIRAMSLIDESHLGASPDLLIKLVPDKTNNTLSIIDTGIGMTKEDLMHKFGAISMDRQKKYMRIIENHKKAASFADVPDMERGFRLGFFSAYLVANKFMVTTKHKDGEQYVCESQVGASGDSFITITRDTCGDSLVRGTKVTLYLLEDQRHYLEECRLNDMVKDMVKKDLLIQYPIYILVENKRYQINDDEKKKEWSMKQNQFERLRQIFKNELENNVKDVIVSDRVFELPCWLSIEGILYINPKHHIIENLSNQVEANQVEANRDVGLRIQHQFEICYTRIWFYDMKHGTSFTPKRYY